MSSSKQACVSCFSNAAATAALVSYRNNSEVAVAYGNFQMIGVDRVAVTRALVGWQLVIANK